MRRPAVLVALAMALAGTAAARPVEVTIAGLGLDPGAGTPVVRLVEKSRVGAETRELPIWIGPFEAQAIALEMQGLPSPRPLTHDLMKQLVERLGGKLLRVVVSELRDGTYFAVLHVAAPGGKRLQVDARPSDGIALALRLRAPILVAEELFTPAAVIEAATPARLWGLTLQDLTPEIATFFDLAGARGVLVSDVAVAAPARAVQRGDLIVALDDAPVASLAELARRAGAHAPATQVRLAVRRGNRELRFSFTPE